MDINELDYYYNKFKFGEDNYHNLMKKRVSTILLVSTFYDAFIFEQDGRFAEQIYGEYYSLNLSTNPQITTVPSGKKALELLKIKKFDLVITMMRIGDINAFEFSKFVKSLCPDAPVLLLLNVPSDIAILEQNKDKMNYIDDVFLWNGDAKLFLAMIKQVEDKWNIDYDTKNGLIQVILLVEDSVEYYSLFLPLIYGVILKQTQKLILEELNDISKRLRMRGRPKIVLAHNYQDAMYVFNKYKDNISAVITDARYPNNGKLDPHAGVNLIKAVKKMNPYIATVLQSSNLDNLKSADSVNSRFFHKYSKTLLNDLGKFINKRLGFGDFIFYDKNNNEIDRAHTMREFEEKLSDIPDETLIFHSKLNQFSEWLIAHGEILAAGKIRPIKVDEFKSVEELRVFLINVFKDVRYSRSRGKIINFKDKGLNEVDQVVRLGEGSFGGKGRGLAFLNALLCAMEYDEKIPEVNITLPSTSIIGAEEFDKFIENNSINDSIIEKSDKDIKKIFLEGKLSDELNKKLEIYIKEIKYPIAVRSSGLLEDSQSQPFAGIYETFLLPNNSDRCGVRLNQLKQAIKLVYSSVFWENTRKYIESINYKLEEEKMAVIIQEIVGSRHVEKTGNEFYYPHFSGVGQSYNFYPTSYMENSDGVVSLAVGLGKSVVEGEKIFRFCPKYPKMEAVSEKELIKDSQKEFYAINLKNKEFNLEEGEDVTLSKLDLNVAKNHNVLQNMVSEWDYENGRLISGLNNNGFIVVTFADILKYNSFPLAKIMTELLSIGQIALGVPVEIEFAVNLDNDTQKNNVPTFYLLQIRPLTVNLSDTILDLSKVNKKNLMLYTEHGMGNGIIDSVKNIIFVNRNRFDKTKTELMKDEINKLNLKMKEKNELYILLGPGRWGTRDRFLGIPVKWNDIDYAKIIVEYGMQDFNIESSQGTHFFHNLVAMNVGYFTVPFSNKNNFINWEWLEEQEVYEETNFFIHVKLEKPIIIKMDGRKGISIIEKF